MGEIRVRRMRPGDVAAAAGINRAITRRRASARWTAMVRMLIQHGPGECLVAEEGGRVVGYILGEMKEFAFGAERSGWIEVLGVHPRHMGRGVGKLLGQRLLSTFRRKGATRVFTAVGWDSGDLLAFFRSVGFDRSAFIILENGSA
ncbi:MAG: GNAT family N-acetyltransferase [Euryarchaeota archaeon]|nr:GNAT family N-acetyltransferase [Euryarchaeota archaeon]